MGGGDPFPFPSFKAGDSAFTQEQRLTRHFDSKAPKTVYTARQRYEKTGLQYEINSGPAAWHEEMQGEFVSRATELASVAAALQGDLAKEARYEEVTQAWVAGGGPECRFVITKREEYLAGLTKHQEAQAAWAAVPGNTAPQPTPPQEWVTDAAYVAAQGEIALLTDPDTLALPVGAGVPTEEEIYKTAWKLYWEDFRKKHGVIDAQELAKAKALKQRMPGSDKHLDPAELWRRKSAIFQEAMASKPPLLTREHAVLNFIDCLCP